LKPGTVAPASLLANAKTHLPKGMTNLRGKPKFAWFKHEGKYQTPVYKVFVLQCIALPLSSGITFCSLQFFFFMAVSRRPFNPI